MSLTTRVLLLRTHAPISPDDCVEPTIKRFEAEIIQRVRQELLE